MIATSLLKGALWVIKLFLVLVWGCVLTCSILISFGSSLTWSLEEEVRIEDNILNQYFSKSEKKILLWKTLILQLCYYYLLSMASHCDLRKTLMTGKRTKPLSLMREMSICFSNSVIQFTEEDFTILFWKWNLSHFLTNETSHTFFISFTFFHFHQVSIL